MKKMLFILIALFAVNINAQVLQPVQYKTLKFYNEAGTLVTGSLAATDTIVSEAIYLDADLYTFGMYAGLLDTLYFNLHYMLGSGPATGNGFYARGGIAMAAKVDSMISLGLRTSVVGQTAKLVITNPYSANPTGWTALGGSVGGAHDSVATYSNPVAITGYQWFKIVIIPYAPLEVTNTTWLNQNLMVIRRFRN